MHDLQLRAHSSSRAVLSTQYYSSCSLPYYKSTVLQSVEGRVLGTPTWDDVGLLLGTPKDSYLGRCGTPTWDDVGSHGPRNLQSRVSVACAHPRSVRAGHVHVCGHGVLYQECARPQAARPTKLAQARLGLWLLSGKGKG